jgi:glycosyltransferase involved in cell wall biosynthesis
MHIAILLPYPADTAGSQRYRLEQWRPDLIALGVDVTTHHLIDDPDLIPGLWRRPPRGAAVRGVIGAGLRRVRDALRLDADVVIVHREATLLGPPVVEWLLARRRPLIVDFDDAIWLPPAGAGAWSLAAALRMPGKLNWTLRWAAGASAGNRYLADHARRYLRDVAIVPSTIDVRRTYTTVRRHGPVSPLTLGWTGSHSTAPYLEAILPQLDSLRRTLAIRLRVIGAAVRHPSLDIECVPWQPGSEVADLLGIDVGLMPLPDDPWTRGKCGLKALQYMALGIPPVVAAVGVNREIVEDGRNGLLVTDPSGWEAAITRLAEPTMRATIGAAARRTVEERYSSGIAAERLLRLSESVIARGRP